MLGLLAAEKVPQIATPEIARLRPTEASVTTTTNVGMLPSTTSAKMRL